MAPAVAVGTAAAGLALAIVAAVLRPEAESRFLPGLPFGLAVDPLAAVVLPAVAAVTLLVLVFSAADVEDGRARFTGLMLLFAAAVAVTVTATTLTTLLFAWEVMGATSYALVGFSWRDRDKVGAGTTAFLTTRTADLGLYLAAGAALAGGGGLALADLPAAAGPWRDVVAAGVLVAALGKAAQLPFSFWLSRAMEGPSPVSALLHSAAMVAMGGYLLLRTAPLLESTGWAGPVTAWAGVLTALTLGAVAIAQSDLKQLLAASTAAQLGFVVLAAGVGSVSGGAAHLVAHAATKAALFLAAGAWLSALGTKQLTALPGAARRWPVVGACAAVGLLTLAGIPPLSLWATKDDVLAVAREQSVALYVAGLAAAGMSAAYAAKALWQLLRPIPPDADAGYDTEEVGNRRIRTPQVAPVVVLAAGAAVLGLLVWPPAGTELRAALGESGAPRPPLLDLVLSATVALAVVAAVARVDLPEPRWAARWLGLGILTDRLVTRPVLRLAELLARFDDRVLDRAVLSTGRAALAPARALARFDDRMLDGAVGGLSAGTLRAARGAAVADTAGVDGAAEGVAAVTRRLGGLARRTQTGQLHQYYVLATLVLGAGLALLLLTG
ncbi:NADH-quinone oxidoreductase subunit L [Blastococcus sp. TF02-09]|nr:NADH-quinone oxidoreductase subunit L [Blastococcus sp. TF02-9]